MDVLLKALKQELDLKGEWKIKRPPFMVRIENDDGPDAYIVQLHLEKCSSS
jgi:hypothetical protein